MSFTAAASGFVFLLLSAQVLQAQTVWKVNYLETNVCAPKGSSENVFCYYKEPPRINDTVAAVEKKFWFTKMNGEEALDLMMDSDFTGRVRYDYTQDSKYCSLKISDLRMNDSAEYKLMLLTNLTDEGFIGSPALNLTITELQVQVTRLRVHHSDIFAELSCLSRCRPPYTSYVWYNSGEQIRGVETFSYRDWVSLQHNISCAFGHFKDFPSPPVYAPRLPSVSVSPSAEIVEGSSVTLTCSSDANPAANHTWFKENQTVISEDPQLVFSSIQSSDSGEYHCEAENQLGSRTSGHISVNVKYAPRRPSVSVSPSAEIVEGSSVTLTCSSDANPAASYTWIKENQTVFQGPQGIYHFPSINSKDSGVYYCKSENQHGSALSSFLFIDVQDKSLMIIDIIRLILTVSMLIPLLLLCLWIRKMETQLNSTKNKPKKTVELDSCSVYENSLDAAPETKDTEEQEDLV